jgi:hypothetical protein
MARERVFAVMDGAIAHFRAWVKPRSKRLRQAGIL